MEIDEEILDVSMFYERFPMCSRTVTLDRGDNTTCTVNLHGGTVVSWRVRNIEQLYVSRTVVFNEQKIIRGGIPIVFPKFRDWAFGPYNGFASICHWDIEKPPHLISPSLDVVAIFSLSDTDYTRSMWNYSFKIMYTLRLSEKQLNFQIDVHNTSKLNSFKCHLLMHNYFKMKNVKQCVLHSDELAGAAYYDFNSNTYSKQFKRILEIRDDCMDRIYKNSPDLYSLVDNGVKKTLKISKDNFADTIVWNPWENQAKTIVDFCEGEHLNMISVQFGAIHNPIYLKSDEHFKAAQNFELMI